MKKHIHFLLIVLLTIAFSSCRKIFFNCIRGNNELISETRYTNSFSGIASEGSFNVVLSYDTVSSVEIKAESNLIPYINTYTSNDKLYLTVDDNRCLRENVPITINIKNPIIDNIELTGSGDINCNGFNPNSFYTEITGSGNININTYTEYLEAKLTGSGDIKLSGSSDFTELTITGSGNIWATDLLHNVSKIDISGSGDIFVYAEKSISGQITGSGNLYYKGNPLIDVSITGSGVIYKY